jgi:hypothetical protein
MFDFAITMWLGGKDAGAYVGRSRDWAETCATPWDDEPVPGRIRYKYEGADRRYYRPDLDAKLTLKPTGSPKRNGQGHLVAK